MSYSTDPYVNRVRMREKEYFSRPRLWRMSRWNAFWRKYQSVSIRERIKLLLKVFLRVFGIRKCLFLGGYCIEEDILQQLQDLEVYCSLLKDRMLIFDQKQKEYVQETKNYESLHITEKIRSLLEKKKTYIALMTENLDCGGLEKVVQMLALEYRARNLPVKVFCVWEEGKIAEELKNSGVEVLAFHGKEKDFAEYITENRPLLVNTHYVVDFLAVLERKKIPVIEVIHNMYVFLTPDRLVREKEKANVVARYIAVSETAKKVFLQKIPQVEAERVAVIGNAVSITRKKTRSKEQAREAFQIPQEAFVYLSVGSIDSRKNQIGIIRAFDIISHIIEEPVCLVFAGGVTDDAYKQKVMQIIRERELEKTVSLLGHCDEIQDLMSAADVFVLDSYYEGWSVAATEALYSALPVIHSECGSGKELVADGRNGILIGNPLNHLADYKNIPLNDAMHAGLNDNIQQMAEAMLQMYENREMWQKRKNAIREYAEKEFSVEKQIEQYLSIYLEACK